MEQIIQEGSQPEEGVAPLKFDTVYARSLVQQYRVCLWKFNITYWRTPNYNATRFSFSIAVALIFGACFWKLGGKTGNEQQVGIERMAVALMHHLVAGHHKLSVQDGLLAFFSYRWWLKLFSTSYVCPFSSISTCDTAFAAQSRCSIAFSSVLL